MVQDDPERKIDAWLDEALARYSTAEPPPGLERRVLESLRAQKQRLLRRGWKAWAPALATAAAVIVVTVVVLRNHDFPPGRTVTTEIAPAQAPAPPPETAAGERNPETMAGKQALEKPGKSNLQRPTGAVHGAERPAKALPSTGESSSTRAGNGATSSPPSGGVFPMPVPLSEQERLAMAVVRSGLISPEQPGIPPGDEPLPQVVIEEIEIRPLQEIKPIGREGV
jgi:hypothetical protein